jgi:hypothetical protein
VPSKQGNHTQTKQLNPSQAARPKHRNRAESRERQRRQCEYQQQSMARERVRSTQVMGVHRAYNACGCVLTAAPSVCQAPRQRQASSNGACLALKQRALIPRSSLSASCPSTLRRAAAASPNSPVQRSCQQCTWPACARQCRQRRTQVVPLPRQPQPVWPGFWSTPLASLLGHLVPSQRNTRRSPMLPHTAPRTLGCCAVAASLSTRTTSSTDAAPCAVLADTSRIWWSAQHSVGQPKPGHCFD